MTRTTSRMLIFRHPFRLSSAADVQPGGSYVVETDKEQLDTSREAYRWLATFIRLPCTPGTAEVGRIIDIDRGELGAVLKEEQRCRKGPQKPAWTGAFADGVVTVDHSGAIVSLGATRHANSPPRVPRGASPNLVTRKHHLLLSNRANEDSHRL